MPSSTFTPRNLALALTVALAVACGSSEPSATRPESAARTRVPPARRALLVGIDRYAPNTDKRFRRLEGAVRDVALVRSTLTADFGFTSADVKTLTNEKATHANIVKAFDEFLIEPAGENTEVLFWFSGHGSRVPDESGRKDAEPDGLDSTLLAYDSRPEGAKRVFDITDDEIQSLLQRLAKKTGRITIVTDACHSGGVTRGLESRRIGKVRSGPDATVPLDLERIRRLLPSAVKFYDDGDPRPDIASRYVHISACTERQLAREYVVKDESGKRIVNGALTFFLTQVLRGAKPGDTYLEILRHAALLVSTYVPGQTAVIEGFVDRKLFSGEFAERPAGFPAQFADGRIVIAAGTLHGIRPGSVVEVEDYREKPLCKARVERARIDAAFAQIEGDTKPEEHVPLLVEEVQRPTSVPPLSVRATDPALRKLIEASPWAVLDPHGAYELDPGDDGQPNLVMSDGHRVSCKNGLDPLLRKELRYQELRKLATESSDFELHARFVPPNSDEIAKGTDSTDKLVPAQVERLAARGSAVAPVWRGELAPYPDDKPKGQRVGELITIEVTNKSAKELYLGVLCLSQTREINTICPRRGRSVRIAAHGTQRVRVWVGAESNATWPDRAGPLTERYLVIGTTMPIDYDSFTQGKIAVNRGDTLPGILRMAIEQPIVTRGRKVVTSDRRFGVTWLDLQIDRR